MATGQAELYEGAWSAGLYGGYGEGTDVHRTTPLLNTLIERLLGQSGANTPSRVFEGGSGSGDHAVTLARAGFAVLANEYSPVAAAKIVSRTTDGSINGSGGTIVVAQGDILECLRGQEPGSFDGFYSSSVFHTFNPKERLSVYGAVYNVQPVGGLLAVSFKAAGDYVQDVAGHLERHTDAGAVCADEAGGISRLFVHNSKPLIEELERSGYDLVRAYDWAVPREEVSGDGATQYRKFVGFLACKKGGG